MSEQIPATNANDANVTGSSENTNAKAQKPRKRAQKDTFAVSDLARARLRKRGVKSDERLSDECKVVRGILRSNFALVQKNDANVRKAKDAANDRKPWPRDMNKHTFDVAVNGKRAKS